MPHIRAGRSWAPSAGRTSLSNRAAAWPGASWETPSGNSARCSTSPPASSRQARRLVVPQSTARKGPELIRGSGAGSCALRKGSGRTANRFPRRLGSDHFQIVAIRQGRERGGGQGLVPIGDRGDVVLQGQVAAVLVGAPAEGLDGDAEIGREADRVHDVPAVQAEALLRAVDAVGPDHLRQAGVGGGELHVFAFTVALDDAGVEVVGAAEIVLRARAADGREGRSEER